MFRSIKIILDTAKNTYKKATPMLVFKDFLGTYTCPNCSKNIDLLEDTVSFCPYCGQTMKEY
jgi:ssDNA-binding Zn-finger/Zn-ribbon topoisomerase 1